MRNFIKKLVYYLMSLFHVKREGKAVVQFIVGYEGISGGSEAIANIANNLCGDFKVFFAIGPLSNFNLWLSSKSSSFAWGSAGTEA